MVRPVVMSALLAGQAAALPDFPALPEITHAAVAIAARDDSAEPVCSTVQRFVDLCSSAAGGINTKIAGCLCCSGTAYTTIFDNWAHTCASYVKTAMPESTDLYSAYVEVETYCAAAGSDACGGGTKTATSSGGTTTGTASDSGSSAGCDKVSEILKECAAGDAKWLDEPTDVQAACYCYETDGKTVSWVPDEFDGAASQCASWAKTAQPDNYSGYLDLSNLCHDAGDFIGSGSSMSSTASSSTHATSTGVPAAAETGSGTKPAATASPPGATATSTPTAKNAADGLAMHKSLALGAAGAVVALFLV